jgi:hypothetical protein
MHVKSESELRNARWRCLHKHGEDAWPIYCDEAVARDSANDDGPRDAYDKTRPRSFWKSPIAPGCLRRSIWAGHIPMPTMPA